MNCSVRPEMSDFRCRYQFGYVQGKNEDVLVALSRNGGVDFGPAVRVNQAVPGRRFMPWIAADGDTAYVNWYDRRDANNRDNGLTRYFGAVVSADVDGRLSAREADISGADDQEFLNIWPASPRKRCGFVGKWRVVVFPGLLSTQGGDDFNRPFRVRESVFGASVVSQGFAWPS